MATRRGGAVWAVRGPATAVSRAMENALDGSPERRRVIFRLKGAGKGVQKVERETRMSDGFLLEPNSTLAGKRLQMYFKWMTIRTTATLIKRQVLASGS